MNRGEIPHIRIGNRILVPKARLEQFLAFGERTGSAIAVRLHWVIVNVRLHGTLVNERLQRAAVNERLPRFP